eukprot:5282032-Karenia_brevis.AAC.1
MDADDFSDEQLLSVTLPGAPTVAAAHPAQAPLGPMCTTPYVPSSHGQKPVESKEVQQLQALLNSLSAHKDALPASS